MCVRILFKTPIIAPKCHCIRDCLNDNKLERDDQCVALRAILVFCMTRAQM